MRKIIITEAQFNKYIKSVLLEYDNKTNVSRINKFYTMIPDLLLLKQQYNLSILQDEPYEDYKDDLEGIKEEFTNNPQLFFNYLETGEIPLGDDDANIASEDPDAVAFVNLRVNNVYPRGENKFVEAMTQIGTARAKEGQEFRDARKLQNQTEVEKNVSAKQQRIKEFLEQTKAVSKKIASEDADAINALCEKFGDYAYDGDEIYGPVRKGPNGLVFPPNWVNLRRELKKMGYTCGAVSTFTANKCLFGCYDVTKA